MVQTKKKYHKCFHTFCQSNFTTILLCVIVETNKSGKKLKFHRIKKNIKQRRHHLNNEIIVFCSGSETQGFICNMVRSNKASLARKSKYKQYFLPAKTSSICK